LDAGFDLQVGRAPPAAKDGGLDFDIAVQHVAAFQLDHLADSQPNGDDIRMAVTVELHDGVRAKVPSLLEIVVQDRLHRDQLRAGSRQCVLIRRQHSGYTPIQPRFDDPCGAALYAIGSEITGGGRWNLKERPCADGERLRLGKGKFGQGEIVELEVAEPSSRPADRIRICDHRWDDVKDLLDAVDLEGNQDTTDAVLRPVAVVIQVRCVVIPGWKVSLGSVGLLAALLLSLVPPDAGGSCFSLDTLDGALFPLASSGVWGRCFLCRFGW
jgi:hypothetical protein